jgi:hypothetical protein
VHDHVHAQALLLLFILLSAVGFQEDGVIDGKYFEFVARSQLVQSACPAIIKK